VPARRVDDALRDGEPEPRAAVLGGHERHEEVREHALRDAGPGVLDPELHPALELAVGLRARLLERAHRQVAAALHRLRRVLAEVDQHLAQPLGVDPHAR